MERKGPLSCQFFLETGLNFSFFFSRRFKPFHFSLADAENYFRKNKQEPRKNINDKYLIYNYLKRWFLVVSWTALLLKFGFVVQNT